MLEGDSLEVRLELTAQSKVDWLELEFRVPPRARLLEGEQLLVLGLGTGETRTLRYRVQYPRWGVYPVGSLRLLSAHRLFTVTSSAERDPAPHVRVYPQLTRLRRLVKPLATRPASGSRPAAASGEGIEFAELRDFRAGERVATLERRGEVERALRKIDPAASSANATSSIPWIPLTLLFDASRGHRGVRLLER